MSKDTEKRNTGTADAGAHINVYATDYLESVRCPFCGSYTHNTPSACPQVKKIVYTEDGSIKEIEKR